MALSLHHLNCGTLCPLGRRFIAGEGGVLERSQMICHCLLIETPNSGLVLVDTGFGTQEVADPRGKLGAPFATLMGLRLSEQETALHHVQRLGFSPEDVRHILVTHLDLDHAGGLPDFPRAKVHVYELEHQAAMQPTLRESQRYKSHQWAHHPNWQLYSKTSGEPWFGFPCVRSLEGLPPEILSIPLPGHTRGHSALAVNTKEGWLLHAGDAYFHRGEIHEGEPPCPAGLRAFQNLVEINHTQRIANQQRLRELARDHGRDVQIFCAHDPMELQRAAHTPA